ncbi:Beta-ketoacyl-acyl-carrier-protein synthase I [Paracidovorax avenae ATCC 19860]|uniref:3-oxoacyl-[acyl-carrier-protein] synthase 1 n=1 Tax=Paracidovorax avenae (strain ATCC 19860 / DSM 7227 / CCUG 15838 / JCM 20985 / LMG 2117 / NCPPB 1011) TaxID=643561 RepID=F0Q1F0_PARA1|nr:beta-ketoacyl synthase N-terminal-like domain-containing protein [Paracidovorax avenae]ADX45298.1 Beta-ketoacyl-acyl-carrier-protein synthase I [Paracidovorax avenae ATCC 19860]
MQPPHTAALPRALRRVAVTGMGIVSCLGNDLPTVARALHGGHSGVRHVPEYAELGFRSQVAGIPDLSAAPPIDRKLGRFMGDAARYAYHAARQAIQDAALGAQDVAHPRTGLIVGSGVGSLAEHAAAMDVMRTKGASRIPPYATPRVMGSTASANLSTAFGIQGTSYTLTSACASSAHCIGHAAELIQWGKQDRVIAGGAEEVRWTSTALFDAMGALAAARNDATASRPYDQDRDGFVIAGGAGILVLEELEHARRRGARIHAELVGYGACSDGLDMVTPDKAGCARALRLAWDEAGRIPIDYVNTHGTSTRLGDIAELLALRDVFGADVPPLSSTKGLTGHSIAAAAAQEAIYCLLMMQGGFLAGNAHIDNPDPDTEGFPLLMQRADRTVDTIMSNSFGFGGTNASLILRRYRGD